MSKAQAKRFALQPLTLLLVLVFAFSTLLTVTHVGHARAANTPFTKAFLRLDNLTATTFTTARVCFQPTTTSAIHTIVVVFPTTNGTDYVIDSTASDWGLDTTNLDSGQTAVTNLPANPTVSGKQVTVTLSADLTPSASNLYCFNFNKQAGTGIIKTSSAGANETTQGTITTNTSAPAVINQTTYSESIISNNQVVVSATVPPSFTFVLNGNTDGFASNLSTGSVNTSNGGRTITITTNAAGGWIIWAQDLNSSSGKGALQSATAGNYKIPGSASPGTASAIFTAGAENYGLAATINTDAAGGGTVSLDGAYDGSTSNFAGTLDPTRFRPIASANGTANGDIINVKELVTIAGQTPAASDYTDTISYVGAGQF